MINQIYKNKIRQRVMQIADKIVVAKDTSVENYHCYEIGRIGTPEAFFNFRICRIDGNAVLVKHDVQLSPTTTYWNVVMRDLIIIAKMPHEVLKNRTVEIFYRDDQISKKLKIMEKEVLPKIQMGYDSGISRYDSESAHRVFKKIKDEFDRCGIIMPEDLSYLNGIYRIAKSYDDLFYGIDR